MHRDPPQSARTVRRRAPSDPTPAVAVERARMVPDRYRTFAADPSHNASVFGLQDGLLQELLDLGLPHERRDGRLFLDPLDLENTTHLLGLPSPYRSALDLWSRSLRDPDSLTGSRYQITLRWTCPAPGHAAQCRFAAATQALAAVLQETGPAQADSLTVQVETADTWHDFGKAIEPLVAAAAELAFHKVRWPLAGDPGFVRETGLAECRLATRHLLRVAEEAGIAAGAACGFFLGLPFPAPHAWLEVRTEDGWCAADPFFLGTLHGWGVLDPHDWPVRRSPRQLLWRTGVEFSSHVPLLTHNGHSVPVRVTARRTRRGLLRGPADQEGISPGGLPCPRSRP
ncbi:MULTISPECIES: hypothetical protein [Kitasatospora]|uniref:hypothetical protein n=1 Tax=Kitasatospora TaxID=2063 RepID=UPI000C712F38|nr:hypothetical protein [Kitasatospora sp. GP30]MDH6145166.1 hypothetical protein [Kitasatospora sp. GP30]